MTMIKVGLNKIIKLFPYVFKTQDNRLEKKQSLIDSLANHEASKEELNKLVDLFKDEGIPKREIRGVFIRSKDQAKEEVRNSFMAIGSRFNDTLTNCRNRYQDIVLGESAIVKRKIFDDFQTFSGESVKMMQLVSEYGNTDDPEKELELLNQLHESSHIATKYCTFARHMMTKSIVDEDQFTNRTVRRDDGNNFHTIDDIQMNFAVHRNTLESHHIFRKNVCAALARTEIIKDKKLISDLDYLENCDTCCSIYDDVD